MSHNLQFSRLALAILIVVAVAVGVSPTALRAGDISTSAANHDSAFSPSVRADEPQAVTEEDLAGLEATLVAMFQIKVDALFEGGLDEQEDKESQAEFDRLVTEWGNVLYRYYVEQGQGTIQDARQRMRYRLENISDSGIGLAEPYIDWAVAQVVAAAGPVDVPEPTPTPYEITPGLQTFGRAADGTMSGVYTDPVLPGGPVVGFSVTADGVASYQVQEAAGAETVVARYVDEAQATVEWKGVEIDGYGPLTGEQRAALADLSSDTLIDAIALIPLELGCQEEAEIDPLQLAALLLPWQMRLKYLSTDRVEEAGDMAARSSCPYFTSTEGQEVNASEQGLSSQILLSRAAPVPVVMGYFPFDVDGALEPVSSLGVGTSCRMPTAFARNIPPHPLFTSNLDTSSRRGPGHLTLIKVDGRVRGERTIPQQISIVQTDKFGHCGAMCRGACGMDCTLTNCTQTEEWHCVQGENGLNIGHGDMLRTVVYDCGVHPGCIAHDNCYDACNSRWGCGTFVAAHCRHITPAGLVRGGDIVGTSCDGEAIGKYGRTTALNWARGGGPYEERWRFEYNDPFPMARDLRACPPTVLIEWKETGDKPGEVYFVASTLQPEDLPTAFQFQWTFPDPVGAVFAGTGQKSDAVNHVFPGPGTYQVLFTLLTIEGEWVKDELVEVKVTGAKEVEPAGECLGARFHVVQVREDGVKSREYDCILLPKSVWIESAEKIKGAPLTEDEIIGVEDYYAKLILSYSNMEALAKALPPKCLEAVMQDNLWVIFDGSYIDYAGNGTIAYRAQFERGTKISEEKTEQPPPSGTNPFSNIK